MRGFFVALLVLIWAASAGAGPWPRDKGRSFVTLGTTGQTASLWAERGLGRGRWLALDGWYDTGSGNWSIAASYHKAMQDRGGLKLAWFAGVAVGMPKTDINITVPVIYFPSTWQAVIKIRPVVSARVGLSLGKALARPWPGWATLDMRVDLSPAGTRAKAEATVGYRPRERLALIAQMQADMARGQRPDLHLAGSAVWKAGKRVQMELGLRQNLRGGRPQIKAASWLEF